MVPHRSHPACRFTICAGPQDRTAVRFSVPPRPPHASTLQAVSRCLVRPSSTPQPAPAIYAVANDTEPANVPATDTTKATTARKFADKARLAAPPAQCRTGQVCDGDFWCLRCGSFCSGMQHHGSEQSATDVAWSASCPQGLLYRGCKAMQSAGTGSCAQPSAGGVFRRLTFSSTSSRGWRWIGLHQ